MNQVFPKTDFEIACLLIDTAISIYKQTSALSKDFMVCRSSIQRAVHQLQNSNRRSMYACIIFFNNGNMVHVLVNLHCITEQFNKKIK